MGTACYVLIGLNNNNNNVTLDPTHIDSCCGAQTLASGGSDFALTGNNFLCLWLFVFHYVMDFREKARVYALLFGIRKLRSKTRHWLQGIFSKRLLNGQFYKLYEDLRNCWEKFYIHGSVRRHSILIISNKMQQMQVFIYCKITLHVSGVHRTHN